MNLIIVSQNRENIVKFNSNIGLHWQDKRMIIANYIDLGNGEYYELLGKYETRERALEVLNEIQKKINLINMGHNFGSPMIDLKNPTYIYEMPEE